MAYRLSRTSPILAALVSMFLGSLIVLSTVVLINHFVEGIDRNAGLESDQILFNRKPPDEKKALQKPKPKPKPRRTPQTPPPPLMGLGADLSGIDFGLPGYDLTDLNGLDGDLLGSGDGLIMTDDTVDETARATFQAPMQYPPRAKARGIKGYVVFSLLIGVTGDIEQIKIIESYPEGVFDEAAMQGINQWKFLPAYYQGKAVRAWARQRIRFDLS